MSGTTSRHFSFESTGFNARLWQHNTDHSERFRSADRHITFLFFLAGAHATRLSKTGDSPPCGGPGQAVIITDNELYRWYCEGPMVYLAISMSDTLVDSVDTASNAPLIKRAVASSIWFLDDCGLAQIAIQIASQVVNDVEERRHLNHSPLHKLWAGRIWNCSSRRLFDAKYGLLNRDDSDGSLLNEIAGRIDQRVSEPISVPQLASEFSFSKRHFTRICLSSVGQTPHQFVLSRRLLRTREQLYTRKNSLAEIALLSGFASQSHMTSTFHKRLKMTPLQYQRALKDITLDQD
ncbi:helix-turn-helix transcriptional regulator [Ketobacter sp. MCCC 1A13808]|nr:helix-turn-helix transcriptional regulator [Ketobacter sp. MCCC 1A13808]